MSSGVTGGSQVWVCVVSRPCGLDGSTGWVVGLLMLRWVRVASWATGV